MHAPLQLTSHPIKLRWVIYVRLVEEIIHIVHCPVQLNEMCLQILCIYHGKRLLKPLEHPPVAPVNFLRYPIERSAHLVLCLIIQSPYSLHQLAASMKFLLSHISYRFLDFARNDKKGALVNRNHHQTHLVI